MKKIILSIILSTLISAANAQNDVAKYVVNNVKIQSKGMRFESVQRALEDTATIMISVMFNKNGSVQDVKVNQGIEEIFDGYFRDILFLMPKNIYLPPTINSTTYLNLMFKVATIKLSPDDTRNVELYFKRKRFARIKSDDKGFETQFPDIVNKYKSTPECNSSLWIIRFRAMNLRVWCE